jgi:hypothetical protein
MALELQNILDNIDTISKSIDTNVFIKNARDAVKVGIEAYAVEEDEKAKIYAAFEQQLSATVITQIINVAKEIPVIQAQEELYRKQIVTEEKKALDLVSTTTVRDEQSEQDLLLKGSQKTLIDKQATTEEKKALELESRTKNIDEDTLIKTEQVKTEKGKTMHIAEQIVSEKYRHRDLRSSTAVKIASMEITKQQAKFEESRRYIAIESNYQNAHMKKADFKVQQLQAIATDDDIAISTEQMTDSKNTIDNIPTTKITYNSEVSVTTPTIEDTNIPSVTIT